MNLNTISREIDLETAAIIVHFHSDDTYSAEGFSLVYEILGKIRMVPAVTQSYGIQSG